MKNIHTEYQELIAYKEGVKKVNSKNICLDEDKEKANITATSLTTSTIDYIIATGSVPKIVFITICHNM